MAQGDRVGAIRDLDADASSVREILKQQSSSSMSESAFCVAIHSPHLLRLVSALPALLAQIGFGGFPALPVLNGAWTVRGIQCAEVQSVDCAVVPAVAHRVIGGPISCCGPGDHRGHASIQPRRCDRALRTCWDIRRWGDAVYWLTRFIVGVIEHCLPLGRCF